MSSEGEYVDNGLRTVCELTEQDNKSEKGGMKIKSICGGKKEGKVKDEDERVIVGTCLIRSSLSSRQSQRKKVNNAL